MPALTDETIDRIAQDHVFRRYAGRFVPERLFLLDDPDGAFFAVSAPPSERHQRRLLDNGVFGDTGFFIHRHDGTIRQFDPGDFLPAFRQPSDDPADRKLVAAVLNALRHLS